MIAGYVLLCISFILGSISGFRSYTFLGNYLILSTFFLNQEEKISIFFFQISTYRVFVLSFLGFFLYRMWKKIRFRAISLSIIYVLICFIPVIVHYCSWGLLPYVFIVTMIKPIWVFMLAEEKIEQEFILKLSRYTCLASLLIILLTIIPTFLFYIKFQEPFWRTPEIETKFINFTLSYFMNGKQIPLIYISEIASMNWSACAAFLLYEVYFSREWIKQNRFRKIIQIILPLFFYMNIGLKIILSFFFQILIFLRNHLIMNKNKLIIVVGALILVSLLRPEIKRRFEFEDVNIETKSSFSYNRRNSIIRHTLKRAVSYNPWKGQGYPRANNGDEILPSGQSNMHSSFHSEFVDKIYYFGYPAGLILLILYSLPFLSLVLIYKKIKFLKDGYKNVILSFFAIILFNFVFGSFSRDVYSNVFFLYALVLANQIYYGSRTDTRSSLN